METRVPVTLIFPMRDQQRLMLHVQGWDWPFAPSGPVSLCIGSCRIQMLHEGSANMHGTPAVRRAPTDAAYPDVDAIMRVLSEHDLADVSLEFRQAEPADGRAARVEAPPV